MTEPMYGIKQRRETAFVEDAPFSLGGTSLDSAHHQPLTICQGSALCRRLLLLISPMSVVTFPFVQLYGNST
jgi:hypothetical protein